MTNKVIHVDLGGISHQPDEHITGIPRVTISLARAMSRIARYKSTDISLISLLHDNYKVPDYVLEKFDLENVNTNLMTSRGVIFLLDVYYFKYNFLNKVPIDIRNNFTLVDYIHDILPITTDVNFPISNFKFKNLVRQSFLFSDAIITPSKSTLEDVVEYITSDKEVKIGESLKLGYAHHGADFLPDSKSESTSRLTTILNRPYFLMVGTVEIRKNHFDVISAFEKLWSKGVDVTLCIAGKIGWKVGPVLEKLENHPEKNRRLFFISEPTDRELATLYTNSSCLIFASSAEGFGLPIIEAAQFDVPLLLSDIPVFREVAGPHARYFSLDDERDLSRMIEKFRKDMEAGDIREKSGRINVSTWDQTARKIMDDIIDDHWYCTIYPDKSVEYHCKI